MKYTDYEGDELIITRRGTSGDVEIIIDIKSGRHFPHLLIAAEQVPEFIERLRNEMVPNDRVPLGRFED